MNVTGIGDMALHFMLGRQNTRLSDEIASLSKALATGEKSDKANPVTGDYLLLGDIAHSTRLLDAYDTSCTEAELFLSSAQDALGSVQTGAERLATDLMTAAQSGTGAGLGVAGQSARETFRMIVATLNTSAAGRSVFAGSETQSPALIDGDAMLDDLASSISGSTTAASIRAEVESWFMDAGERFESFAYQGETEPLAPFQTGKETTAHFSIRADREAIRVVLAEVAIAALASDAALSLPTSTQRELIEGSGAELLRHMDGITELRAETGALQSRVEQDGVRNATARTSLDLARADLLSVDPYDTATRLESTRIQLETLYTVTARLSSLTLANYLR